MQVVEIGVDTCRSRCVHGNVRFGEKWGKKGEGGGGVRVELKVMVESWDNDGDGGTSLWVPAGLPGGQNPSA